jgi:BirA family transcriptional regulator, biotin operon repressor / biotin---[acetyl-CoA-carboxylase] ligase
VRTRYNGGVDRDPEGKLLDLLDASPANEVSLDRAIAALVATRTQIEALVASLRARGRLVEISPADAIRMETAPRPVRRGELRERPPGSIGSPMVLLAEADSTNEEALRRVERGEAPHGLAIAAESQTLGRGRGGNRWFSPPSAGLWFSAVLRPDFDGERIPWMTQAAGLAASRGIERSTGIRTLLKWPNDLHFEGKKVAGILTESVSCGPEVAAVVGIGIDVNVPARGFPPELAPVATSLRAAAGAPLDRAALLDAILDALGESYEDLRRGRTRALDRAIAERSAVLGKRVRLLDGTGVREGIVREQSLAGGLVLETGTGERRAFRGEHIHSVELTC